MKAALPLLLLLLAPQDPPGHLPKQIDVDWTRIADLERLVSVIETEGFWKPDPRKPARKYGVATWGRHLHFGPDRSLVFDIQDNDIRKEREYHKLFYAEYSALFDCVFEQALLKIREQNLLPKQKSFDEKSRWPEKFIRKYPANRKGTPEDIREITLMLTAVLQRRKFVDGALKMRDVPIRREIDRRRKITDKYIKRYDVRPLGWGTARGSAVIEIELSPAVVKPVKDAITRQKVFPVLREDGTHVQVGQDHKLYLSWDFGAREVTDLLKEMTNEFMSAVYREKLSDGSRDVVKIVGAHLLRERYWFIRYDDRVVVMSESMMSGRRK